MQRVLFHTEKVVCNAARKVSADTNIQPFKIELNADADKLMSEVAPV